MSASERIETRGAPVGESARGASARSGRERGAVTAELAMGLPLLLMLTIGLVWLLTLATAQVRVVDASREAARAVSRGDDIAAARGVALRVAPEGARVSLEVGADQVVVETVARVEAPGGFFDAWPAVEVSGQAVAVPEPTGAASE